jgi:UDP-arabinose 4-epimerase
MKTVLVTGGAGYVGSHCCKAFANAGWQVITFDNLSRGWRDAVRWGHLIEGDITDAAAVGRALRTHRPDAVAHFAAYSYVGESILRPDLYYLNNVVGTHTLVDEMRKAGLSNLILSSSCATYGIPEAALIDEAHPQLPINPYGWSKLMSERIIRDHSAAYGLGAVILRYFNAAGAHPDGDIGERHEPETHAIPLAIEAALDPSQPFTVFGSDFETPDGTAIRDYIHVVDLARAHLLAAEMIAGSKGVEVFNLGGGVGTSVLEITQAVGRAVGRPVAMTYGARRKGDPPSLVASSERARRLLGWVPEYSTIDSIVRTAVDWRQSRASEARESDPQTLDHRRYDKKAMLAG